ncbi:hypothetical protein [Phaeocystidibacter luteus]|uniref:DUF255 domain-containing protein n=1 Tax=Phaeocystidibacter luteus TaxID=911197 RepID=A0A6N6RLF1_9FLAO|nr:hypothetical protein [Phaeocystidibacter luteus]KAB2814399.1 hypothetical protein F8C67_01305 [Phaeocystidibacter luteus]
MKKLLLTLAILFSFAGTAKPDFIYVTSLTQWEEVLALAEANRKMIYVYYTSSDDCEPCDFMESSTLGRDVVEDYLNENYLSIYIREGTSFARSFAAGFDIGSVPSSLWMTGSEFVWKMEAGVMEHEKFMRACDKVGFLTQNYGSIMPYAMRGGDTLSVEEWFDLFYIAGANQPQYETRLVSAFRNSLNLDSLKSDRYWPYIMTYVSDLTSPLYQYIKIDWEQTLGEEFPWQAYYDRLYNFNLEIAVSTMDSSMVENMELQLLPTVVRDSADPENLLAYNKLLLWQDYYLGLNDFENYIRVTDEQIIKLEPTDEQMVEIIRTHTSLSRSDYSLDKATEWLNACIKMKPSVQLYIMKADVLIVRNKRTEALQTLGDAQEMSPTEEEQELIDLLLYVIHSTY